MKMVSVIIPTYNRCEDLKQLLHSVAVSDYSNREIVVVNNASTDATERVVQEFMREQKDNVAVQYIASAVNLNAGGGRAEGVRHAKGDYYLFIDDDNEIYPDMISELVDFRRTHPKAGLIAPLSVDGHGNKRVAALGCGMNLTTSKAIFVQAGTPLEEVDRKGRYPTIAATNSFMMTREAYEKSGGWDPYLGIMYEETDLGLRVQKAGFEQFYAPKAITIHWGAVAEGENRELRGLGMGTPERAYTFARNRGIMMRRHAGAGARIAFFILFNPAFTVYYVVQSLRYHRPDIAWGYWRGAWKGCFCAKFGDHSPVLQ